MLPVSGALQLHTSAVISERPIRSASGAYSTFDRPAPSVLVRQEQVPEPFLLGDPLSSSIRRQHDPRILASEQLAHVGLLAR